MLRRATHDVHVRLDHHPLLAGITKPGYPLRTYQHVLLGYFHFYHAIEEAIESCLQAHHLDFDYAARRKHAWIADDLAYFGLDPHASAHLPKEEPGPFAGANAGQAIGMIYTIEGSTLGGQVIARHLAKNLGLTPDTGARFFHGYGAQAPQQWRAFEDFMHTNCADANVQEQACLGAKATFILVERLLDDYHQKLQTCVLRFQ